MNVVQLIYTQHHRGSWVGILDVALAGIEVLEKRMYSTYPRGSTKVRGIVVNDECADWLLMTNNVHPQETDDPTYVGASELLSVYRGDAFRCFIVFQPDQSISRVVSSVEQVIIDERYEQ